MAGLDPALAHRRFIRSVRSLVHRSPASQVERRQWLAVFASRAHEPSLFNFADPFFRGLKLRAQPHLTIEWQVGDLRIDQDHHGALHQPGRLIKGRHPRGSRQRRSPRPPSGHGNPTELGRRPLFWEEAPLISAQGDDFIKHCLNIQPRRSGKGFRRRTDRRPSTVGWRTGGPVEEFQKRSTYQVACTRKKTRSRRAGRSDFSGQRDLPCTVFRPSVSRCQTSRCQLQPLF